MPLKNFRLLILIKNPFWLTLFELTLVLTKIFSNFLFFLFNQRSTFYDLKSIFRPFKKKDDLHTILKFLNFKRFKNFYFKIDVFYELIKYFLIFR